MTSEETFHAITKHAMGDRQGFDELKKRFESMDDWGPPSAAAALAYLIAKDELGAEKEEEEEEPDAYDKVVEIINRFDNQRVNSLSPHNAADQIFTLIYKWLDKSLKAKGHPHNGLAREHIKELFSPFALM